MEGAIRNTDQAEYARDINVMESLLVIEKISLRQILAFKALMKLLLRKIPQNRLKIQTLPKLYHLLKLLKLLQHQRILAKKKDLQFVGWLD